MPPPRRQPAPLRHPGLQSLLPGHHLPFIVPLFGQQAPARIGPPPGAGQHRGRQKNPPYGTGPSPPALCRHGFVQPPPQLSATAPSPRRGQPAEPPSPRKRAEARPRSILSICSRRARSGRRSAPRPANCAISSAARSRWRSSSRAAAAPHRAVRPAPPPAGLTPHAAPPRLSAPRRHRSHPLGISLVLPTMVAAPSELPKTVTAVALTWTAK
jgi:hypothetical protein